MLDDGSVIEYIGVGEGVRSALVAYEEGVALGVVASMLGILPEVDQSAV